jgi:hypothetical protein
MSNSVSEHQDNLALSLASSLPTGPAVVPTIMPGSSSSVAAPITPLNPFDPRVIADDEHNPLYLADPQSWAQRNPTVGVQKLRVRAKLTDAAKASRLIASQHNKAQAMLLTSAIDDFLDLQRTQIEKLAQDHSWPVSEIKKLINNSTNY